MELPIFGPAPDVPLCQTADGSCGACCGLYNFKDRSDDAHRRRLRRRTDLVTAAWPDVDALREAKETLMNEERDDVLFATVRVCPYAGYVEEPDDAPARVGCLLHPLRHPDGADLRDLGVYPKEVCGGHFCANHEWLRPRERAFAATCTGDAYGRVVTDAGLVKGLVQLLEEQLARPLRTKDCVRTSTMAPAFDAFWQTLLQWPFRDPDPQRFGSFWVTGADAAEHAALGCLQKVGIDDAPAAERVCDALGTAVSSTEEGRDCLRLLHQVVATLAHALS